MASRTSPPSRSRAAATASRKPAAKRAAGKAATKGPAGRTATKRPAGKAATRKAQPKGVRKVVKKATKGDRPYQFGLVILLFVLLSMAWTPIKNLSAGAERIDQLTAGRDALAAEVTKLEDRKDQLMDPEELELIAREEYGLVKPGEIPYVVVTAEPDPQLGPVEAATEAAERPWYRRVWSSVSELWD